MGTIHWAIIGLGQIAEEFAPAIRQAGGQLYAAGSRDQAKADDFARRHQANLAYGDYDELLADPNVDIVYIATPHVNHAHIIERCLLNGKHVLCEKSITVTGVELARVNALAAARGLLLAEAMTLYHMPLFHQLKAFIEAGKIGNLKMIQVQFGSLKPDDPESRFFHPDLAGGALLDIGTYALSFARFFLSRQPKVIDSAVNRYPTGVDESSGTVLKTDSGELVTVSLTMRAKMPKVGILAGDLGYLTVENYPRADQAVFTAADGTKETLMAGAAKDALVYEAQAMQRAVKSLPEMDQQSLEYKKAWAQAQIALCTEQSADVMDLMDQIRQHWKKSDSQL